MSKEPPASIVLLYNDRKRLALLPKTFAELEDLATQAFKADYKGNVIFQISRFGEKLELDPSAFGLLKSGEKIECSMSSEGLEELAARDMQARVPAIKVVTPRKEIKGKSVITMPSSTGVLPVHAQSNVVRELLERVTKHLDAAVRHMRLTNKGFNIQGRHSVLDAAQDDAEYHPNVSAVNPAKPTIYLLPPKPLKDVKVFLQLSPQWGLTVIDSVVAVGKIPDGSTLMSWITPTPDTESVFEVLNVGRGRSKTKSLAEVAGFDPSAPKLLPDNAALLGFEAFVPHLDAALTGLSLAAAARADFFSYWLPQFLAIHDQGQEIAFRFVPQNAYAQAAALEVQPRPDTMTRVFLLFGGVNTQGSKTDWKGARDRAGTVNWAKEVGMDPAALDPAKFRVVEWGGMEVRLV